MTIPSCVKHMADGYLLEQNVKVSSITSSIWQVRPRALRLSSVRGILKFMPGPER
jgi:hypothetical protein